MRRFPGPNYSRAFTLLVASVGWLLGAILAQAQQGPPTVRSIDVEYTGPATVSKERIIAQLRTGVGKPYSDAVVEQDIRQLYSTGAIRNVRIFAQPEGEGVKVIVAVQTRSVVREIEIDGAQTVNAKRLRKEITELDKELARVNGKLANAQFLSRAPAEVVEKERAIQRELTEKRAALEQRLRVFGG